jgi:hypothetical protein
MSNGSGAPPLPPPQPPAIAARTVREAAQAVAGAWGQPMDPASHNLAISQLYSILRDLGIATKGLARYQTTGHPASPASQDFRQLVASSAERLLRASESLDGVPAAEGLEAVPDPEEPGTLLCRATRNAITAWRQPSGTSAERDAIVEPLITAIGFLSAATRSLATYAPRRRTIELHAVAAILGEVTARLAKASPSSQGPGRE